MTMPVSISRLHFPVTTLGPGRRLGIWFQGCSIQCRGCISIDTWDKTRGLTTIDSIIDIMKDWIPLTDGFTISGGEPFDQPDALFVLLQELRRRSTGDILVFTGYSYEAVRPLVIKVPGLIDALISDPFELKVPQSLALRGSDNQRLHFLTSLGRTRFAQFERRLEHDDQRLDIMFDDDGGVWFAGIPRRDDFVRLRKLLQDDGHIVLVGQDEASANKD